MRDDLLLQIRPKLNVATADNDLENFQNQTLRPILKLQNDILVLSAKNHLQKYFSKTKTTVIEDKNEWLKQHLSNDAKLRQLLLGIVIGHFTTSEHMYFLKNDREIRKRINTLLVQRLSDQI